MSLVGVYHIPFAGFGPQFGSQFLQGLFQGLIGLFGLDLGILIGLIGQPGQIEIQLGLGLGLLGEVTEIEIDLDIVAARFGIRIETGCQVDLDRLGAAIPRCLGSSLLLRRSAQPKQQQPAKQGVQPGHDEHDEQNTG